MEGRGSKEEEEVVAAAAAAAAASAVADDELVEGAPFPDPGREEEEEDDDDDGEDARAVTTRLWERAGERGRSSRGAAEAEEEKEVEVEVEPAKRMLSAACIEDDDAADAEEDITAGARSALALFGVAPGAARTAETMPLPLGRALLVREGGAAAVEALLLNMVVVERGMAFSIFFFSWKRMAVDN